MVSTTASRELNVAVAGRRGALAVSPRDVPGPAHRRRPSAARGAVVPDGQQRTCDIYPAPTGRAAAADDPGAPGRPRRPRPVAADAERDPSSEWTGYGRGMPSLVAVHRRRPSCHRARGRPPLLGRTVFDKQFTGPPVAHGAVRDGSGAAGADGLLHYVALERLGSPEGARARSVLQHVGRWPAGAEHRVSPSCRSRARATSSACGTGTMHAPEGTRPRPTTTWADRRPTPRAPRPPCRVEPDARPRAGTAPDESTFAAPTPRCRRRCRAAADRESPLQRAADVAGVQGVHPTSSFGIHRQLAPRLDALRGHELGRSTRRASVSELVTIDARLEQLRPSYACRAARRCRRDRCARRHPRRAPAARGRARPRTGCRGRRPRREQTKPPWYDPAQPPGDRRSRAGRGWTRADVHHAVGAELALAASSQPRLSAAWSVASASGSPSWSGVRRRPCGSTRRRRCGSTRRPTGRPGRRARGRRRARPAARSTRRRRRGRSAPPRERRRTRRARSGRDDVAHALGQVSERPRLATVTSHPRARASATTACPTNCVPPSMSIRHPRPCPRVAPTVDPLRRQRSAPLASRPSPAATGSIRCGHLGSPRGRTAMGALAPSRRAPATTRSVRCSRSTARWSPGAQPGEHEPRHHGARGDRSSCACSSARAGSTCSRAARCTRREPCPQCVGALFLEPAPATSCSG